MVVFFLFTASLLQLLLWWHKLYTFWINKTVEIGNFAVCLFIINTMSYCLVNTLFIMKSQQEMG